MVPRTKISASPSVGMNTDCQSIIAFDHRVGFTEALNGLTLAPVRSEGGCGEVFVRNRTEINLVRVVCVGTRPEPVFEPAIELKRLRRP